MRKLTEIDVHLNLLGEVTPLCRLSLSPDGQLAWRYSTEILDSGLEVSPLTAPLNRDTHVIDIRTRLGLQGLPGFIADALPDRWGMRVMEVALAEAGLLDPSVCDRLAWQSDRAIGALEFQPSLDYINEETSWSLRQLQSSARNVAAGNSEVLSQAYKHAAGSAGGAYPKFSLAINDDGALTSTDTLSEGYRPVIIKVPVESDLQNRVEISYARMAEHTGIAVPRCELLEDEERGWFVIDRFDRTATNYAYKLHQCTLAGLLDMDIAEQAISAEMALAACRHLTQEQSDVVELYRRILFNYLAHNCDDHGKNFSFLMDGAGHWRLSPWYDGAYCKVNGGHAMRLGRLRVPTSRNRYLELARHAGIRKTDAELILEEIMATLNDWPKYAEQFGVSELNIFEINQVLQANCRSAQT